MYSNTSLRPFKTFIELEMLVVMTKCQTPLVVLKVHIYLATQIDMNKNSLIFQQHDKFHALILTEFHKKT